MGLLYGHTGRLTAQNGGFRPGQKHKKAIRDSFSKCAESVLRYHAYAKLDKTRHLVISVQEASLAKQVLPTLLPPHTALLRSSMDLVAMS